MFRRAILNGIAISPSLSETVMTYSLVVLILQISPYKGMYLATVLTVPTIFNRRIISSIRIPGNSKKF